MKKENYIIGGGLTGLLCAYYLKDYKLISKQQNLGGQLKSSFQLGPRFVRHNKHLIRLLNDLKIKFKTKIIRTGYYDGEHILDKMNYHLARKYALTTHNSKLVSENFMNDGLTEMEVLDFKMKDLIKLLTAKVKNRIINANVVSTNNYTRLLLLSNNKKLQYNKLISTIHYINLCSLLGKLDNVKCKDIYFYYTKKAPIKFDKNKFSFIYCITRNLPFNRITVCKDYFVLESTDELTATEKKYYKITQTECLKNCKINNMYELIKFKNITPVGRYATLDNEKRIHTVIDDIVKLKLQ